MAKKIKAGIIGFGNVGQALEKQLSKDQAWNVKFVICEKGAISSGYNILMWGGVGYNATVGGGTMMLDELKNRINLNNFSNIYLVINGTINFILDEMTKREQSLDTIIKKVQAAGYCEPGQNNILDIINQEIIEDVGKKI